jgi:tRNA/tmRNA/rRNA uracil-C5-methylase (TrmA/RlmC/RlmD family)
VAKLIEVEVGKIVHGGHALGKSITGECTKPLFLKNAIPGESGLAQITSENSKIARGELKELKVVSPDRVTPPCRFAANSTCGGCSFQFINPNRFDQIKAEILLDQLSRIGKIDLADLKNPVQLNEKRSSEYLKLNWSNWRTRMVFAITKNKIGLHSARSNDVIEIDTCLIANEKINQALAQIQSDFFPNGRYNPRNSLLIDLPRTLEDEVGRLKIVANSKGEPSILLNEEVISGPEISFEEVAGFTYQVSAQSFWQGHQSAADILLSDAVNLLFIKAQDHLLDLYGGVGLFGIGIARASAAQGKKLAKVTSMELDGYSSEDAKVNYRNLAQEVPGVVCEVKEGKVERLIKSVTSAEVIVLDPPRAGATAEVIDVMMRISPREILYISCDPASFARDAKLILADGRYQLAALNSYDLFPATAALESMALFTLTR